MAWNDKYWDIISNLYWTPRYLGLKSIPRNKWQIEDDRIRVSKDLITNTSGPLYSRARTFDETKTYLNGQEEILNQVFNLMFSIAGDAVLSRLLCRPLGIDDNGPFESIGREIGARYGWRKSENVTQQDGFFVTAKSLVAIEMKLGSTSWPEQIAKYVALMIWEEAKFGAKSNLGLLFIVPEAAMADHWNNVGLNGPTMQAEFYDRLDRDKLPKKILELFDSHYDTVRNVLGRLCLAVTSWRSFQEQIEVIEGELDSSNVGEQTLKRLLEGLRAQIIDNDLAGVGRS